jgi:hypothetical protein
VRICLVGLFSKHLRAMSTASLDDFMALNDQVAALVEAGVPLDVDLGPPRQTAATLERINALIARRVSQGCSNSDSAAKTSPPV